MNTSSRLTGVFALAILAIFIVSYAGGAEKAMSQPASTPINGYAWSDNIGWISLSGANYGLTVAGDGTGTVSGYAWSDNIGWVSANVSTGCPSGTCTPRLQSGALTGWLKALSADGNGWDGWISLSGSGYGITHSGTAFSGFAWGSDVVGWVDFSFATVSLPAPTCTNGANNPPACNQCPANLFWNGASCIPCSNGGCTGLGGNAGDPDGSLVCINGATNPPACDALTPSCSILTANPDTITAGGTLTLRWECQDAAACTQVANTDGFSTGGALIGTDSTVTPSATSGDVTYGLTCDGTNFLFPSVTVLSPQVSISADPARVRTGNTSTISWSATEVDSCTITGPGLTPNPRSDFSAVTTSQPVTISTQSTYTITCDSLSDSVTVNIIPVFDEF